MVRDEAYDPEASYAIARERRETAMADIEELLGRDSIEYLLRAISMSTCPHSF